MLILFTAFNYQFIQYKTIVFGTQTVVNLGLSAHLLQLDFYTYFALL